MSGVATISRAEWRQEKRKRHARQAGLRYVTDEGPGIRRVRRGKGFDYVSPSGKVVRDGRTLARIRSLVIPPAWEEVWIATSANAHLQATGRDDRGRKQFKYHPKWREVRDGNKYEKVIDFGRALPRIRRVTGRHLRLPGLPREKVLAAVVQCLEKTLIRVGNEEYANTNKSYGLTTIRDRHARVRGGRVHFAFAGKSGVRHEIDLNDPKLARVIKASQELPGQELFQYVDDDGNVRDVKSEDVNEYLREIAGEEFTAKDFRTWAGTVLAAGALRELEGFSGPCTALRGTLTPTLSRSTGRGGEGEKSEIRSTKFETNPKDRNPKRGGRGGKRGQGAQASRLNGGEHTELKKDLKAAGTTKAERKKNVVRAVERVAERLGNTKAVCRKCYIHPAVIDAYLDGSLVETLRQRAERNFRSGGALRPEEAAVLAFLSRRAGSGRG